MIINCWSNTFGLIEIRTHFSLFFFPSIPRLIDFRQWVHEENVISAICIEECVRSLPDIVFRVNVK